MLRFWNKKIALSLCCLNPGASEIEPTRLDLDADKGTTKLGARDASSACPHEGVTHSLIGVGAPVDQPIQVSLCSAAGMAGLGAFGMVH